MLDTLNLANSIWPNGIQVDSDGYAVFYPLGTNKIEVPISSAEWPRGDKLISPFVYNENDENDEVVGFIDTKALIVSENTTIYLPYTHIEADFSSIEKGKLSIHAPNATTKKVSWKDSGMEDIPEAQFKYKGCKTIDDAKAVNANNNYKITDIVNGTWSEPLWDLEQGNDGGYTDGMFSYCSELTTFTSDLPNLTNGNHMFYTSNLSEFSSDLPNLTDGAWMFASCYNITSFYSDLPSLTNGGGTFNCCHNLTIFSSNLSSLTNGEKMFEYCDNLTSFSSDLSSLMSGYMMFTTCSKLTSFNVDLSSLTDGVHMFYRCTALTSFSSDLSNLTNGSNMFRDCSNLTSFSSNLSNLTNGESMFSNCKLDTASVQNIADTINNYNGGTIDIDIGNSYPNVQEEASFSKIASKGWTVYVNGSLSHEGEGFCCASCCATCCASCYDCYECGATCCASLMTLDETDGEFVAPKPYWAKPVPSDEEHARYVDSEGNFYNILGAQFIYGDNLETYGMFTSLEDAQAQMRLKKIGEEEIPTA